MYSTRDYPAVIEDELLALNLYAQSGLRPDRQFLMAVLCNDLQVAIESATPLQMANLPAFVRYVAAELPRGCWGDIEKVARWIDMKVEEKRAGRASHDPE